MNIDQQKDSRNLFALSQKCLDHDYHENKPKILQEILAIKPENTLSEISQLLKELQFLIKNEQPFESKMLEMCKIIYHAIYAPTLRRLPI